MKGRQQSLTAFQKGTNLSSCLLADLLILLVMILYSSSLLFYSFLLFEEERYFSTLTVSENTPTPYKYIRRPSCQHWVAVPVESVALIPVSLASAFNCVLPFPWGALCPQSCFSKICSLGPQGITTLHPFLDFACHSWCPKDVSSAHLFHCKMTSFLNSHFHYYKEINYCLQGILQFLMLFLI